MIWQKRTIIDGIKYPKMLTFLESDRLFVNAKDLSEAEVKAWYRKENGSEKILILINFHESARVVRYDDGEEYSLMLGVGKSKFREFKVFANFETMEKDVEYKKKQEMKKTNKDRYTADELKEYWNNWYSVNREAKIEATKKWNAENKAKLTEYKKRWREKQKLKDEVNK